MKNERIDLLECQFKLLVIWLSFLLVAVFFMATRTMLGPSEDEQKIWAWFLPMFLPSLTLMIGAYASATFNHSSSENPEITVDRGFFQITLGCSVFYLLMLVFVVINEPSVNTSPLDFFSRTSFFLSPIQAVTTACLGWLFVSQDKSK